MFDFLQIKKMLGSYAGELKKLRDQIEALEIQREDVLFAPVVLADVRAAMVGWVDSMRGAYQSTLKQSLTSLASQRNVIEAPDNFAQVMRSRPLMRSATMGGWENDLALCGLFGDILLKAIDASLSQLEWSKDGLSSAERTRRLEDVDKKLKALRADEASLVTAANEVGVNVSAVE